VWTVQELAMATYRNLQVVTGQGSCWWLDLALFTTFCIDRRIGVDNFDLSSISVELLSLLNAHITHFTILSSITPQRVVDSTFLDSQLQRSVSLHSIIQSPMLEATEPKDKVYSQLWAVQSLAQEKDVRSH